MKIKKQELLIFLDLSYNLLSNIETSDIINDEIVDIWVSELDKLYIKIRGY